MNFDIYTRIHTYIHKRIIYFFLTTVFVTFIKDTLNNRMMLRSSFVKCL